MTQTDQDGRDPELLALAALEFLAREPERLQRFMALSGMSPHYLHQNAADPAVLAAVLDHLLADETLLFVFAEAESLHPSEIGKARRKLPGATSLS